jgi:hypothetical protein
MLLSMTNQVLVLVLANRAKYHHGDSPHIYSKNNDHSTLPVQVSSTYCTFLRSKKIRGNCNCTTFEWPLWSLSVIEVTPFFQSFKPCGQRSTFCHIRLTPIMMWKFYFKPFLQWPFHRKRRPSRLYNKKSGFSTHIDRK